MKARKLSYFDALSVACTGCGSMKSIEQIKGDVKFKGGQWYVLCRTSQRNRPVNELIPQDTNHGLTSENFWKDTMLANGTICLSISIKQMANELFPGWSGASRNRAAIVAAQAVINHAAELELCERIKVKRFDEETKEKIPATLEWVKAFMGTASPNLGAYALFMYLTGCRPSEAVNVKWSDVDLKAKTVLLRETKGGTERTAHLPDLLFVTLANLPRVTGRGIFLPALRRLPTRLGLRNRAGRHQAPNAALYAPRLRYQPSPSRR